MGQLAALEVVDQVPQPLDQVLAAGFDRALEDHRVGGEEVVRAHCLDQRLGGEAQLGALVFRNTLYLLRRLDEVLSEHEVGLVQQGIGGVLAPCRVGKPAVFARQFCGGRVLAQHPAEHTLPQRHRFLDHALERLWLERHRLGPPLRHQHELRRVEQVGAGTRPLLRKEIAPHGLQLSGNRHPFCLARRSCRTPALAKSAQHFAHRLSLQVEQGAERILAVGHQ